MSARILPFPVLRHRPGCRECCALRTRRWLRGIKTAALIVGGIAFLLLCAIASGGPA